MVKIIDNYILEREIGKGQFGSVFKGYNKVNGVDIAVKSIARDKLKGKFYELLENEIRVLRACDNINIIKLYDIKKTQNNIYLVTEYCNEGDLMQYLKEKKRLTEEEAVDFLIQIVNAFKTLTKNKIMHRDFKLANILKHNGMIKIADFGFAKLLGSDSLAATMLGSPLNMAPEVLDGKHYDNKADIWSVGTCFYELIFGRPPYVGQNIIDLTRNIKTKPLTINRKICDISALAEDLLRKMLVVDPSKRIDWEGIFNHKLLTYQDEEVKKDLEETLNGEDMMLNMSRFYVKNNKVITHVADISKKEDLNNFAALMAQQGAKKQAQGEGFKGIVVNRNKAREDDDVTCASKDTSCSEESKGDSLMTEETRREVLIKTYKRNSNRLLHERNKYVFLASVTEDAITAKNRTSDLVGFLLIKKLFVLITQLKQILQNKTNIFSLGEFETYVKTRDYSDICSYVAREYDVFKVYYESMQENVKKSISQKKYERLSKDFVDALAYSTPESVDRVYNKTLLEYVNEVKDGLKPEQKKDKKIWLHLNQIMDCLELDAVFTFGSGANQFNFKLYYEEIKQQETETIMTMVLKKMAKKY